MPRRTAATRILSLAGLALLLAAADAAAELRWSTPIGRLNLYLEPAGGSAPWLPEPWGLFDPLTPRERFYLPIERPPTRFERSAVVRLARVFLRSAPVAEFGPVRVRLKIILE